MDGDHGVKVWTPDLFIVNEVGVKKHQYAKNNELLIFSPNGTVKISERVTITATCPMELRHYPFDSQTCTLEIESCNCFNTHPNCSIYIFMLNMRILHNNKLVTPPAT